MKICVDTVILIDILKDEFKDFQEKLNAALAAKETLIAPVVVHAELMCQFVGNTKLVASFLKDHKISIAPLEIDAVGIAGARWMRYLKRKSKSKCPKLPALFSLFLFILTYLIETVLADQPRRTY